MGPGDLQVQVWQRRLPCVVEPALVLARPDGTALALGLARAFEAWLTRAFWSVLDASELLAGSPPSGSTVSDPGPDPRALADWLELRRTTDAASWTLRWLGDSVADTQARDGSAIELIDRYEHLVEILHARLERGRPRSTSERADLAWRAGLDRGEAAVDAIALSAALGGALVLCSAREPDAAPVAVEVLAAAEVSPSECLPGDSSLLGAERGIVREAIAAAGLAAMLHDVPTLAALRARVAFRDERDAIDPWDGARAFWYRL